MNSQRHQEGEGVVGQHHQIHAGQKGREERQHAVRRRFVVAVAEAVEACRCPTEIDDDKEKRSQRIDAEMGAEPRQSDRQGQVGGIRRVTEQPADGPEQCDHGKSPTWRRR